MSKKAPNPGQRLVPDSFASTMIDINIDAALRHSRFIRDTIDKQQREFDSDLRKRIASIDKNSPFYSEHMDFIHEDLVHIKQVLPEIQWKSQFVFAMSLLEFTLNEICEMAKDGAELDIDFEDFRGQGIERSKLYLSKVFGSSNFSDDRWHILKSLSRVRNIVVHANGELSGKKDAINPINFLQKKMKGLFVLDYNDKEVKLKKKTDPTGRVVMTAEFVVDALERIKEFVTELSKAGVPDSALAARPRHPGK